MSEQSITITKEQFDDAIIAANEKWRAISAEKSGEDEDGEIGNNFAEFMMSLQNIAFGGLIKLVLFGEDEDNKEEE